uniref:Porphobilinogen deaminase n=1 Tax=Candidatus Kentrum sp. MB TaxID=2138164 RepID=A0A450XFA9_9GAMM|nr:MAG: hydroxymethylbilane synthase [Candidatus Kentron sp. MB]VFK27975.1 MAG: hydroxymethylbilane synthase [Candidatus Kentron sp. MB]VFK74490.1 MAG: hydroxymethylbilane synthase [Candidatus Kentron sp. MB]
MSISHQETIRIATRRSPLAMWQATYVGDRLREYYPDIDIRLVPIVTEGDRISDTPLARIGGKGLFVKELERALLDGSADIAAHSMKDVPAILPDKLALPVILAREDPRDALISNRDSRLDELSSGARIGTCSLRRQCQVRELRSDLELMDLRGNVGTRLSKLDAGEFDGIILAVAGLKRLGFQDRISETFPQSVILPAIGQGAIGIECRREDIHTGAKIRILNDLPTARCVQAERAMNGVLAGGCQAPVAGYAEIEQGYLRLWGLVGKPDGSRILRAQDKLSVESVYTPDGVIDESTAAGLGRAVAKALLDRGAEEILAALR